MDILKTVEGWIDPASPAAPGAPPVSIVAVSAAPEGIVALPSDPSYPRGIRNNNPGNIDRDGTTWQGLAADQSSDSRFCVFIDAQHGIRALVEILLTYQTVHGLKTITAMITRWAPPSENDTSAYIAAVCGGTGIGADTPVDMHDANVCRLISAAIIAHENADYRYPDDVLSAGMALAGVA
jgi:hypothetical protein